MPDQATNPLSIPVYQILLSLIDHDLHGYAILRDVEERTGGEVKLAAGTLYAAISRLVRDGLIEELEEVAAEDPRRRYYRITANGRAAAAADAERMLRCVRMAEDKELLPAASGKRT